MTTSLILLSAAIIIPVFLSFYYRLKIKQQSELQKILKHSVAERILELKSVNFNLQRAITKKEEVETSYYDLIESTPLCIKVFNEKGNLLFLNKGGRDEHFIKASDDVTKWDWLGTVKPAYKNEAKKSFEKALKGEETAIEFEHTPEGSKHGWCSGIISPIKDKNGRVKSILFYSADITALKKTEEELKRAKTNVEKQVQERTQQLTEEKSRLLASINSLSLGFIMVDINGNVILSNKAVENFFKPVPEERIFKNAAEELKGILDLKNQYETAIKEKKTIDIKKVPFGNKYLRIFMAPIFLIEGRSGIIGVVILLEDITEQELLAESKSNFMAIASHEMRTPLTIIRGDAELLLQSLKPTKTNKNTMKFLSGIRQNSIRLLGILNDFIDVTNLEEKYLKIIKKKIDVVKLAKEIMADFKNLASQKKLYLKLKKPEMPAPMVSADADKTRQIITNLLGNALHYTEKGGVTIEIEPIAEADKNFIKISITDTGAGIPPENQSMLFQKFSTIQKTFLHTKEYGSGLGLYISKLLVEAMGGMIKLEKSIPNVGSTFSVSLPAAS